MKVACVSLVQRDTDGKILVIWNKRYGTWTLPGGMNEEGETYLQTQMRELREETGLETRAARLIYEADTGTGHEGRAQRVYVYRAYLTSPTVWLQAKEQEPGCAVTWFTWDEFLRWTEFAEFYVRLEWGMHGQV